MYICIYGTKKDETGQHHSRSGSLRQGPHRAFVKRKSLSAIVRGALSEWLTKNVDTETELLIAEKDEKRLLKILESDKFIPAESAKKTSAYEYQLQ